MKLLCRAGVYWLMLAIGVWPAVPAPKVVGPPAKEPWEAPALERGKVIYGTDDRIDVYQETDAQRLSWAQSTCALVDASQLDLNEDGVYSLETSAYRVDGLTPCPGEPFAEQPSAAFCSGFMVGSDLIATAGHCVDDFHLDRTRFVFGFHMTDGSTPVLTFLPSQVYTPVEIVGSALSNSEDYAVLRVDRPITAADAQVLEVRRSGIVPIGARVGIIGHPWGLPTKLAFGDNSVVRDNRPNGYFITNLDTFGGNSGSPVFNAQTGRVEGILVRGEVDFVTEPTCFRSNVVSNTGGRGEDVSKSTTFADLIPGGRGQLALDKGAYRCEDVLEVILTDLDLRQAATATIHITTMAGDQETVVLDEQDVLGTFLGMAPIGAGDIATGSGVLEVAEGHSLIVAYEDADNGQGAPAVVTAGATIDCTAPVIANVRVEQAGGISFVVAFETSEPAVGVVRAGLSCAVLDNEARGEFTTDHHVTVTGLDPLTRYFFRVSALDAAANESAQQPQDGCHEVATTEYADPFVEAFLELTSDIVGTSVTFTPDVSVSGYHACAVSRTSFPSGATCGQRLLLRDDAYMEYVLPAGKEFPFYGIAYTRLFIGSNGYITFGQGDATYDPTLASHFMLPRISGYFSDLVPRAGGMMLVKEFEDRIAVTYDDVPDYYGDRHSFQMELFYGGNIRLTWLKLTQPLGVVGLSPGGGIPAEFVPSDLSAYADCGGGVLPEADCGDERILACAGGDWPFRGVVPRSWAGDVAIVLLALAALVARSARTGRLG